MFFFRKNRFFKAIKKGNLNEVESLLKKIDISGLVNKEGMSPLIYSIICHNFTAMKAILEHNCNPDTSHSPGQNDYDLSPLHYAVRYNEPEMVKLLLEYKADFEQQDIKGRTPLHTACRRGCFECAKLLVDAGASLSAQTVFGNTPLHYACEIGNLNLIKLLVEAGASVDQLCDDVESPVYWAFKGMHIEALRYLIQQNADISKLELNSLHLKVIKGEKLDSFDGVNGQDVLGRTPLFYAIGNKVLEDLLIAAGADSGHRDMFELTACEYGVVEI